MSEYVGKGIATIGAAGVCGCLIYVTKGESGIGWFIITLLLIW